MLDLIPRCNFGPFYRIWTKIAHSKMDQNCQFGVLYHFQNFLMHSLILVQIRANPTRYRTPWKIFLGQKLFFFCKLGCVVRIVVDSILLHAESGPNDHRKYAPLFTFSGWQTVFTLKPFNNQFKALSKRFFESFREVDKHMNFLITECGLTPTIIAENPLVLTSDPYILKERCLFLQYYIENNGIPSSLHKFDFIRLKGKTTQGKFSLLFGYSIPGTVPVNGWNCPGQLSANKT